MTRDDIIRMAREQGLPETTNEGVFIVNTDDLGRMLAAEREACAAICDAEGREWDSDDVVTEKNYAAHCAHRIRARGDA